MLLGQLRQCMRVLATTGKLEKKLNDSRRQNNASRTSTEVHERTTRAQRALLVPATVSWTRDRFNFGRVRDSFLRRVHEGMRSETLRLHGRGESIHI